ncbi:MAG: hypothetical protein ACI854_000076 [Arenicella sp.]|jgi:hypothetical protein
MPFQLCQRAAVVCFREPLNNVFIDAVLLYILTLYLILNSSISANLVSL